MADYAEWTVRDNEKAVQPLPAFVDAAGATYDLSGSAFRMDLKTDPTAPSAAATLTSGGGHIDTADAANGLLTLIYDAAEHALAAGTYHFDLIRDPSGDRETMLYGLVIIEKGITGS